MLYMGVRAISYPPNKNFFHYTATSNIQSSLKTRYKASNSLELKFHMFISFISFVILSETMNSKLTDIP